ncbi:DUF4132 domain-containing protein [Actinomadura sp. NTSP31]|uniref:DUF4132 domain-containing protein n=1 Tax=Actinomadura sp. NTSP31 TaxID=1735447 RepID=UPI0035BFAB57
MDDRTLPEDPPVGPGYFPRRGGAAGDVPEIDSQATAAVRAELERNEALIEAVLRGGGTDPRIAERVRRHLSGEPDPLGAGAAGAIVVGLTDRGNGPVLVDAWLSEHGLAFAACAFVEQHAVIVEKAAPPRWIRPLAEAPANPRHWVDDAAARRLRQLLAAATEQEHRAAVARLDGHRRDPLRRALVSFLVPDRTDWVAECCAEDAGVQADTVHWLLMCSVGSAEHLDLLGARAALRPDEAVLPVMSTLIEGVGAAAAPLLGDVIAETKTPWQVMQVLAGMPSDEALRILLTHARDERAYAQAVRAIERFPVRAVPVLARLARTRPVVAELLGRHLRSHPELAGAVVAVLPEADRRTAERLGPPSPRPEKPVPWTAPELKAVEWVDVARLPQILLKGREYALPADATGQFVAMLAEGHPDIETVAQMCDPGSLAEFAWAVFETREFRTLPRPSAGWIHEAIGRFGDDTTARRLAPIVADWPKSKRHREAQVALRVFSEIGTDVALRQLDRLARKARFGGLRDAARRELDRAARERGLTAEQLADRLVPDLDLDADGTLVLDYGPRRFTVGFDERLAPYVTDTGGKRRASLPKPAATDDPETAHAAYERFKQLKKDVRAIAADQVARLERAMVDGRSWTAAEFQALLAGHPLVRHVARRLVWATGEGVTFRLDDDRTLSDVRDDAFTLPATARVTIAHPALLPLDAWSEIFADYEILQPFPQIGRTVHALTGDERKGSRLARFEGRTVPLGRVLQLDRRGWGRHRPSDGPEQVWVSRPVADGLHVVVTLSPGIAVDPEERVPEQRLTDVWINDRPAGFRDRVGAHTFDEIDATTASEILADLIGLTEGT